MGYEVSYNEFDYAKAYLVCQKVTRDLEEVQQRVKAAQRAAEQSQHRLSALGMSVCKVVRSPSLDVLASKLDGGLVLINLSSAESKDITATIGQARGNYEAAEARVEHEILLTSVPHAISQILSGMKDNDMRPSTEDMETALRLMMFFRIDLTSGWGQTFGQQIVNQTKHLATVLRHFRNQQNKEIVITQKDPPEYVSVGGGLDSYYELHSMLEDQGPEENGKFMVVQTDKDSYIVMLPGTQDGREYESPFDDVGVGDGFGYESENYADAIVQALEDSGAKDGSKVTFSGYSQGGIHAAQLMKNKKLKGKFKLNKMITLGSPIASIDIPDDVRSLSLEDQKDMVPGLDGTPNKNRGRHHLTTIFDGPSERIKRLTREESTFGTPHKLINYGDHLQELDLDTRPEVREKLDSFHLPRTPIKTQKFKIQRKPRTMTKEQQEKVVKHLGTISPGH